MQPLDLTQGFAIPAGIDSPAGQTPGSADGGETFAAMVQGILGTSDDAGAAEGADGEAAEPSSPDAGLTAALDPVDLSVLLSLVAPVPVPHPAPVVQPTPDVPVAAGDVPDAITAAGSSRPRSVDLPADPVPIDAGRVRDRPTVCELPYSPSQGLASASLGATGRDAIAPGVHSPGGAAQGGASTDATVSAPGSAARDAVPAPIAAASAMISEPSATRADGEPMLASLTEMNPSAGTPVGDTLTIDGAAPKAPRGPVPAPAHAPARTRGAIPLSAMSADAATAAALMTVATVSESIEATAASSASPAPPSDARGGAPADTIAVPAAPVRAMARDLARLAATVTATPVVAATGATGPGTDGPGQETGQGSNGNAGVPGGDPVVSAPVVADPGWVAQASTAVGAASVEGTPLSSSAAFATGAPATAVGAAPSLGAGVGDAGLGAVTSSRASQIEALLGAGDPDRQNLHSIVRTIRVTGSVDGVSEARLRLQPEHLGQVALNVRVEQGSVTAHFHAESPEARQWIETHQHELRSALRQQGLEVKELVVSADPDRRQQGRQDEARERPRQRQRRDEPAAWDAPRFDVTV